MLRLVSESATPNKGIERTASGRINQHGMGRRSCLTRSPEPTTGGMVPQADCSDVSSLTRPRPRRRVARVLVTWAGVVVLTMVGLATAGRMRLSGDSSLWPIAVIWVAPIAMCVYFAMQQLRSRGSLRTSTAAIGVFCLFMAPLTLVITSVDPLGVGSTLRGGITLAWAGVWFVVVVLLLRRPRTRWGRVLVTVFGVLLASGITGALLETMSGMLFRSQESMVSFFYSNPVAAGQIYAGMPLLFAVFALMVATVVFAAALPLSPVHGLEASGEQRHRADGVR